MSGDQSDQSSSSAPADEIGGSSSLKVSNHVNETTVNSSSMTDMSKSNSSPISVDSSVTQPQSLRQDLVQSAIKFLNDPKVQQAPLARRIAFLDSKGLTQSEIQEALSKMTSTSSNSTSSLPSSTVTSPAVNQTTPTANNNISTQQPPTVPPPPPTHLIPQPGYLQGTAPVSYTYQQPSPGQYAYGPYNPASLVLAHQQQQQLKQRNVWDWKDIALAAISLTGLSYGVYTLAKKYISWSSETNFENSTKKIVSEVSSANSSLELLSQEALEAKQLLAKQHDKMEESTKEMEKLIKALDQREKEKVNALETLRKEMDSIREMMPKVMEKSKEAQLNSLQELQNELRSLKSLVLNRRTAGFSTQNTSYTSTTPSNTQLPINSSSKQVPSVSPSSSLVDPELLNDAASVSSSIESSGLLPSKPYIPSWQLQQGETSS